MTALKDIRIALAQINPIVGDLAGNAAKILDAYQQAKASNADLVICPELSLVGYPPEDIILMPSFRQKAMDGVKDLASKTQNGPALLIGTLWEEEGVVFNAAIWMEAGKILHVQHKTMLPNYGIFDEKRIFAAGTGPKIATWRGIKLGLLICEDMWYPELALAYQKLGAELMIVINASPFEAGKLQHRQELAMAVAKQTNAPLIYVNMVGGQDDIVFDGGSFILDKQGSMYAQLPEFEEALSVISLTGNSAPQQPLSQEETLWRAMMLGLKDYVGKNNFPGIVVGLSGGIDSAITAAIAVDALGKDKVKGVLLPSPYTSKDSIEDAQETARLLGIETMTVPITPGMEIFDQVLSPVFKESGWMNNLSLGGNIQARLRGISLMAISNRFGWLLLSTGNKSEIAVGYTTLYGDSCGGYNVLKDLYKTKIYTLAHWRNAKGKAIPERTISKAPTAELAPGQKDEDQLPPYATLDAILKCHIEGRMSAEEIAAEGYALDMVRKVIAMVRNSEYKRRQSCPGVKLSPMLFGKDRRYPLTNKF